MFNALSILFAQVFTFAPAFALTFTDVPTNHLYKEQIDQLSDKGIIKGNPGGTFAPGKTVNRAEMLIMLYRAAGKNPAVPTKACFSDVQAGEWYSAVVCDAAKSGFVGGYPDGTFKPAKEVNRVESLKMIHTVLGLHVNSAASTDPLKVYTDLSLNAWYTPYMASAFSKNILPIAGQGGTKFYPESALLRGEAAAYIFNALGLTPGTTASSSSSSVQTRSSAAAAASAPAVKMVDVDFPFEDDGTFDAKKSKIYKFNLKQSVIGSIKVEVDAGGTATCRLYKIAVGTSFANEYYLGHVVDNICYMRVSLGNGAYQLEVAPNTSGMNFTVATRIVTGDGNDGFREAMMLPKSTPKTGYIEQEDFAEWYFFKLTKQEKLTVSVTNQAQTKCLIYPMEDVDLFGFSGPVCGEEYNMPAGTYYVGVQKKDQHAGETSFTIQVK